MPLATQIADDIYQVQLPLPFALREVNCYLLRGNSGWSIVDTGINTQDGRDAWVAILAEMQIGPADIQQIVITHPHPDHYGLAGWLQDRCQEAVGTAPTVHYSPGTGQVVIRMDRDAETRATEIADFLRLCGMSVAEAKAAGAETARLQAGFLPHPTQVSWIDADTTVGIGNRKLRAIHAPGHSDAQLIFYDESDRLMLCADQVLTRISPNISIWPATQPNPLGRYVSSLQTLFEMDVRLALPGHRTLIRDWQTRLVELVEHHEQRLAEMFHTVGDGASVVHVSRQVFRNRALTSHELRFAVTETLAHLDYLVRRELLLREESDQGMWIFRQADIEYMRLLPRIHQN